MKTVPLGEVATIERSGVDPTVLDRDTPYLGLEHITPGGLIREYSSVGRAELTSTKFMFDERQVLFGKLRPNLGKIARPDRAGVCSTDILPITPSTRLDRGYLAHYLSQPSMVAFAASRTSGANLPRLSPGVLATFEVPLPRIEEQRRIAAILDKADAIRAKRRQVLAHLDALTQSIFHELIAQGPVRTVRLGEIARFIGGASLPEGVPYRGEGHGTLLMKVSDMNRVGNEREILTTALWTDAPVPRASVAPSDSVVLPKRGASIATNKKRITTRPTSLDPNLMAVHPDPRVLTPAYTFAWFQAFDLASITSGSTVPQLNKQDLAPLMIPLPELDQQHAFSEKLSAVVRQAEVVRLGGQRLDSLFASLQSRAFKGEL